MQFQKCLTVSMLFTQVPRTSSQLQNEEGGDQKQGPGVGGAGRVPEVLQGGQCSLQSLVSGKKGGLTCIL